MQEIFNQIITDIEHTAWQELLSVITQIASVWYARKNNILVYPTGIIGVLLAAWVYVFISNPPAYAYGILNVYYFAMSAYGWYNWAIKNEVEEDAYPISWCSKKELWLGIGGFLLIWLLVYFLLIKITNASMPVLESLISASAMTAMWWMAKRKIENWYAWIISNIIALPFNFYQGYMFFTLMYAILLVLAIMGLIDWRKEEKQSRISV